MPSLYQDVCNTCGRIVRTAVHSDGGTSTVCIHCDHPKPEKKKVKVGNDNKDQYTSNR